LFNVSVNVDSRVKNKSLGYWLSSKLPHSQN
jgi:hypothetical protein